MRFKGFIGPSYTLRSVNVDCQRCVNLFLEKDELGTGKEEEPFALLPTPGLVTLATLPTSPVRGTYTASNGTLFVAAGNALYSVDSSWNATAIGTLLTTTGPVRMKDNGIQLMVVDGANGYYWTFGSTLVAQVDTIGVNSLTGVPGHVYKFTINGTLVSYTSVLGDAQLNILNGLLTAMTAAGVKSSGAISGTGSSAVLTITANTAGNANTYSSVDSQLTVTNITANVNSGPSFTRVTDPAWAGADMVDCLDSYFLFNQPRSQQFYFLGPISQQNPTFPAFSALDFASAEGNPDPLVGLIVANRNLWLFGTQSTEIWYDSGNQNLPFARMQGAFIEIGCAAKFSLARLGNTVFWLGRAEEGQGVVYTASGLSPQRISTHAVEDAIASYGDISDARAYCYQEDGHGFYVLNFTAANSTWVFDLASGAWHERAYTNTQSGKLERHRGDCHAFAYGQHVVGDYQNGNIYAQRTDAYTDFGGPITRLRASPHVTAGLVRIFYSSFQLDLMAGIGIDGTGQGVDPQVILDWSDDGGHSWSMEKWTSAGAIGLRKKRALWRRLGQSRDRVFRVRITDPVEVILIGAEIKLEQGAS